MKKLNPFYIVILSFSILLASCTSSTRITSEPPGASVIINGQVSGETPYIYEDDRISFSTTHIKLEKEGYEDFYFTLERDEELELGPIVGGFFFWPAWLWSFGYSPTHHYVLSPNDYSDVEVVLPDKKTDQIQKLNEMYKEGIIDKEEFEILKKRILQDEKSKTEEESK